MARIVVDGHGYDSAEDAPDLGSLFCVSAKVVKGFENGKEMNFTLRDYEGLAADAVKLPTAGAMPQYADLSTGSSFLAVDTGDFYKYERSGDKWWKI